MANPLARIVPHLGRLNRASRWRRTRGRPRVWAHRGDSAHAPENTMRAFEQARTKGADAIELDVRLDADGNVVVFHDDTLERLCNQAGRIEELSAARCKLLRVGGERVPLLAEVLHELDIEVDVEIKAPRPGRMGDVVAATVKVIKDSRRGDQIVVSSFDPFTLLQVHYAMPTMPIAYIFHDEQALPLRTGWAGRWIGASLFHPQHTLCTEHRVRVWQRAGLPINAWTVDDPAELRRLAALGIDGVFVNDVAHAVQVLAAPSA
jgi:glycerophosphoryl diester phosphodiesterase